MADPANNAPSPQLPSLLTPVLTSRGLFQQAWGIFMAAVGQVLNGENVFTIGDIKIVADGVVHTDWILCNGQAVRIVDYPQLFALIGTKYGAPPSSTTFLVPTIASPQAPSAYVVKGR